MILLKFLFILIIIGAVIFLLGIGLVLNFVRKLFGGSRPQASRGRQKSTGKTKEHVEDRRDPQTANRKIFSKDEGEYIDFTEE